MDARELRALIRPDRVHRDFYVNPELFELEMERIFGRAWLFVAHESQVPNPGDFLSVTLARQPLLVTRDAAGAVHVLLNRCAHRGAQVCTEPYGHTAQLRCPYHGWTYALDGSRLGVPYRKRYAEEFLATEAMRLEPIPRMEMHRGFIFGSFAPSGPSLQTCFGPMMSHLDDMVDRAPEGEIEVGRPFRYRFNANWKIQLENQNDMYHPMFTHESTTDERGAQFRRQGAEQDEAGKVQLLGANTALNDAWERLQLGGYSFGHTFSGSFPVDRGSDGPVQARYRALLAQRYPPQRVAELLGPARHNSIFYPHFTLQYLTTHIRVMNPIAVDCTEDVIYPIRLKGAPEEMWHATIRSNNNSHSPAGLVMTDDMEVWSRCQAGLRAQTGSWVHFARGMEDEARVAAGTYLVTGTTEQCAREQQRAWLRYMLEPDAAAVGA
jgi:benzoate/toluate 1,2-dioxygenase alpha subunit